MAMVEYNNDSYDRCIAELRVRYRGRAVSNNMRNEMAAIGEREAIEAKRTLAYSFGTVAGDEQLLRDLFDASVKVVNVSASSKPGRYYVMFENVSSIDFLLRVGETGELVTLKGDSSISIRVKEEAGTMLTVENLWCGADKHITVDLKPVLKSLKK